MKRPAWRYMKTSTKNNLFLLLLSVCCGDHQNIKPRNQETERPRKQETKKRRKLEAKKPKQTGSQETKKPRNRDTKKPRNQETKKPRKQETEKPRNQEAEKPRNREAKKPRNQWKAHEEKGQAKSSKTTKKKIKTQNRTAKQFKHDLDILHT